MEIEHWDLVEILDTYPGYKKLKEYRTPKGKVIGSVQKADNGVYTIAITKSKTRDLPTVVCSSEHVRLYDKRHKGNIVPLNGHSLSDSEDSLSTALNLVDKLYEDNKVLQGRIEEMDRNYRLLKSSKL